MLNKAVIDLFTLKENAKAIKGKLNKGVKFNAVVKADAYGHGASKVANALYKDVDSFSVALTEEGITLRNSGIDKEILVLIPPLTCEFENVVFHRLTPAVESVESIIALDKECCRQNESVCVHVKFNSGMNRAGVDDLKELNEILMAIKGCKRVKLGGMFSHFACPQNKKSLNVAQNKFLLANNLVKGYNNKAICHISASGGFLSGVQADMVRIGILLYGYKPFKSSLIEVKPIMKVYAPVLKTRHLNANDVALYGDLKSEKDRDISLVRYGYADGLDRKNTQEIFNNRCMDVSAVNGLFSGFYPILEDADVLAKQYGTISYEILTKVALRAQKIYVT